MIPTATVGLVSFFLSFLLYLSTTDAPLKLSPQGCRMSWMSPSYILQPGLNTTWTPLARRYSLWLYREVGWEDDSKLNGVPVLFIPGNAGSSHQVRSIASSATRQYYDSPFEVSETFSSRNMKPLDFFAVEFNEDLSAFHGPTLESQRLYTVKAIDYILSHYPPDTKIIVMGHSMGGVVATSLLPSPHISSIITMSTPHTVPPARFDSRIDSLFKAAKEQIEHDETPILSICGGITDTMIPSEFCTLLPSKTDAFRKTIFTSGLEGCWSGVGHREMVWCHQVRWRVARAALELGLAATPGEKAVVLANWFRGGVEKSFERPMPILDLNSRPHQYLAEGRRLLLRELKGSKTYLLSTSSIGVSPEKGRFTLYLSQGSIADVSAAHSASTKVTVQLCTIAVSQNSSSCQPLVPDELRLVPNPDPSMPFPVPDEGVDEADGVVTFSSPVLVPDAGGSETWINVDIADGDGNGWILADFENQATSDHVAPFFGEVTVQLHPSKLRTDIRLPRFVSNALLVYQVTPRVTPTCKGSLLSPLLLHTSSDAEAHYHRLNDLQSIYLHGHTSGPFLAHLPKSHGINFTIYSSGECGVTGLTVSIHWWTTIGRWAPRYWNAILAWSAGVVSILLFSSWTAWDTGAPMPTIAQSLHKFVRNILPRLLVVFSVASLIPLPANLWLGNSGEPLFAPLAPLILLLSSGFVCISWLVLRILMWPIAKLGDAFGSSRRKEDITLGYRAMGSILFISLLVFLFIPWQVAFLGCFLIHLHTTATDRPTTFEHHDAHNHRTHILLMMTWCLPAVAPVLAVWIRTLATAGFTTPFDGDHFVVNVIGFMLLTHYATSTHGQIFSKRHRLEVVPVGFWYAVGATVSFVLGPRSTYRMYEALNLPTMVVVLFRMLLSPPRS